MSITTRKTLIAIGALALMLGLMSSCSQEGTTAKFTPPPYYSDSVLSQVRADINNGYTILGDGDLDSAVATFAEISNLVKTGVVREYHTACAYARMGQTEEAFNWLNKLVANGFDDPERLKYDQDFASIQDDERMVAVLKKATENADGIDKIMVEGIPEYNESPQKFADMEAFNTWYNEQRRDLRAHSLVWTVGQFQSAMLDLAGKKLAALKDLKAGDPEFDYGLERVREASSLASMYEPWGGVTDLVLAEYHKYAAGSPPDSGLSEANYIAGLAEAMQYGDDDPRQAAAFGMANDYLAKVTEGSKFYPAAQTLTVVDKLREPNADQTLLGAELMSVVEKYRDDPTAYRIISTQYGPETVKLTWPMAINKPDIDGKTVKLSQYKGKAVLIDFWATWCGPCRAELPNLLEMYKIYHPKGFEVLSISLDYKDRTSLDDYRAWIKEQGMTWRHIYDGQDWKTPLAKDFFVSSIPAPFMVGADGSLVAWGDDCRGGDLKDAIEKALGTM